MEITTVYFFGSPPDDGFRFYPDKSGGDYRNLDASIKFPNRAFFYVINYNNTCSINLVEYGVISGNRGFRTFGISVDIEGFEVDESQRKKVFKHLKDYVYDIIVPSGELLHPFNANLRYSIESFNDVSQDLDIWRTNLKRSFKDTFQKHFIPIKKERIGVSERFDGLEIDEITEHDKKILDLKSKNKEQNLSDTCVKDEKSSTINQENKGVETEVAEHEGLVFERSLDNLKDSYKSSSFYKENRGHKPFNQSSFNSSSNSQLIIKNSVKLGCGIILLLNLIISIRNCNGIRELKGKVQSLSYTYTPQRIETKPDKMQIQPYEALSYIDCGQRHYIVQSGEGLSHIVKNIKRICGLQISMELLVQKNNLTYYKEGDYYSIREGDVIDF